MSTRIDTYTHMKIIAEVKDRYGCPSLILRNGENDEFWWRCDDEVEGPFDDEEAARADLSAH